jgi:hypothetical protein
MDQESGNRHVSAGHAAVLSHVEMDEAHEILRLPSEEAEPAAVLPGVRMMPNGDPADAVLWGADEA